MILRRNLFFPESSLWSQNTINSNYFEYDRRSVNLDVSANKRTLDKTDHMDISADLTLAFMSKILTKVLGIYVTSSSYRWDGAGVWLCKLSEG